MNKSVLFLKKKDVITNDNWHLALDIDTNMYEDAIAAIRNDLETVNSQQKEFMPVAEFKQVEASLNALELRLKFPATTP